MTQPNTNIDALRVQLEAAEAALKAAEADRSASWAKYLDEWNTARKAGRSDCHEYAMPYFEASNAARKVVTKARTAVTRAKTALTIAETGVDPREAHKPKKYSATLPDGRVVTRKSPRVYTHAIACPAKGGSEYWCEGWAGSESLAAARVRRLVGLGYKAQAIPAVVA